MADLRELRRVVVAVAHFDDDAGGGRQLQRTGRRGAAVADRHRQDVAVRLFAIQRALPNSRQQQQKHRLKTEGTTNWAHRRQTTNSSHAKPQNQLHHNNGWVCSMDRVTDQEAAFEDIGPGPPFCPALVMVLGSPEHPQGRETEGDVRRKEPEW